SAGGRGSVGRVGLPGDQAGDRRGIQLGAGSRCAGRRRPVVPGRVSRDVAHRSPPRRRPGAAVTPDGWAGAAIGFVGGVGLLMIYQRLRARTLTLDQRVAPYLGGSSARSDLLREQRALTP